MDSLYRSSTQSPDKVLVGWNEWCRLPDLGVPAIKAKIDTGARTSALHAFDTRLTRGGYRTYVEFNAHPLQRRDDIIVPCHALLIDERHIMSSSGHRERRYVILTQLILGGQSWEIELTLSQRDELAFRMLLGREALSHRTIVDPGRELVQGKPRKKQILVYYKTQ